MNIVIGSDHIGYDLKQIIIEHLTKKGHTIEDIGPHSSEIVDYPTYGKKVARHVAENDSTLGILICGTGVGISITANKIKGIRAVVCSEPYSAKLSRQHNNTNILSLGARVIGNELAKMIVDEWLAASFDGGRHATRVNMICNLEDEN